MGGSALAAAAAAGAGFAWAVRGRSSRVFGPSVWRGGAGVRSVALTFDDGPTPQSAQLLRELQVPATFFMCGAQVRRLPSLAREIAAAGHEIGNHTDTHPRLWMRSREFIREEIARAQESIGEATGVQPALFRAPYGVRWFGLREAQREFGLLGVMWTVIGLDWKLDAQAVTARVLSGAGNGAIVCLHDGRELAADPDISTTIDAVREIVPRLLDAGYTFRTVSDLIR